MHALTTIVEGRLLTLLLNKAHSRLHSTYSAYVAVPEKRDLNEANFNLRYISHLKTYVT